MELVKKRFLLYKRKLCRFYCINYELIIFISTLILRKRNADFQFNTAIIFPDYNPEILYKLGIAICYHDKKNIRNNYSTTAFQGQGCHNIWSTSIRKINANRSIAKCSGEGMDIYEWG